MVYTCHSCKFNAKGLELERLLPDGLTSDRQVAIAKDILLSFFRARCANCRRVKQDDIRIVKAPKTEREAVQSSPPGDSGASPRLSVRVADKLRDLIAAILALDEIDALLLFHVARGGSFVDFASFVAQLRERLNQRGGFASRGRARARWERMCGRFAAFDSLCLCRRDEPNGARPRIGSVSRGVKPQSL